MTRKLTRQDDVIRYHSPSNELGDCRAGSDSGQEPRVINTTLGSFQVVSKLGEGGMGEVYRARDTRLNRDVALKVLPPTFARDPERLTRFTREAQLLASLNHSNIAAIYGMEGAALVM